jgi:hypothetical protein
LEFELTKLEGSIEPPEGDIINIFEDDSETVKAEIDAAKDKINTLVKKVTSKLNTDND